MPKALVDPQNHQSSVVGSFKHEKGKPLQESNTTCETKYSPDSGAVIQIKPTTQGNEPWKISSFMAD